MQQLTTRNIWHDAQNHRTFAAEFQIRNPASGYGETNYYIYDDMGRLAEIRDRNNHVVKSFTYHYSTSTGQ